MTEYGLASATGTDWAPSGRRRDSNMSDSGDESDSEKEGSNRTPARRRRDIIHQARLMGGRKAAEEIHSNLHPRYWGITKRQVVQFGKDLREAVGEGHVRNTMPPSAPPYPNDRFEMYGPNMHQVNVMFIKPSTGPNARTVPFASYALQCNPTAGRSCDLFISHVWDEGCFEFIALVVPHWPRDVRGAFVSVFSVPQNLDSAQLVTSAKASPFYRVLETQQVGLILVAGSNVPIHSRLWCVYEAYAAVINGAQIDFIGDPWNLLPEEDKSGAKEAMDNLLEANSDLDRANEEDDDEGFGDIAVEELTEEVRRTKDVFLRLLDEVHLDVRDSQCLHEHDRKVLMADLENDVDDVNDMILQHLHDRFSFYDMPALGTATSGLASMGLGSRPLVREGKRARSFLMERRLSRMSVQEPDDVQEKMQSFRVRRDDEKKAKLIRVLVISLNLMSFGAVMSAAGTILLVGIVSRFETAIGPCDLERVMQLGDLLAQACGITGVLVMSTCCQCSTESLTLDDIIVQQPLQVLLIVAMITIKHFAKFYWKINMPCRSHKVITSGIVYPVLVIPAGLSFYGAATARRTGHIPEWARPTYLFIAVSLLWSSNYGVELFFGEPNINKLINNAGDDGISAEAQLCRRCNDCLHLEHQQVARFMRMLSGFGLAFVSLVLTIIWVTSMWRQGSRLRRNARGSWAMKSAFWFLYAHLVLVCGGFLLGNFVPSVICRNDSVITFIYLAQFVVYALPSILVRLVGWERLLGWMDQKFESTRARRERDGAFIAELLGAVEVELGQPWWVHLEEGEKDTRYPKSDHRHNFVRGTVVNIGKDTFKVKVGNGPPRELQLAGRNCNQEYLVRRARADLRCIEWEQLSLQLFTGDNVQGRMQGSNGLGNLFSLSRPVAEYEVIDFFLSHSWHDSGIDKWVRLEAIASNFRMENGRHPTFWLDRVCIRQENIGDGLAVLPVNVMACNKLLVLAGETYPSRLWCALELVISFAFMPENQAVERVQLEPLGDNGHEVLQQLASFQVEDSHCYDPNEEARVRRVVNAVSKQHFESHIRTLARFLSYSSQSSRHHDMEATARENVRLQSQVRNLHRELQLQKAAADEAASRETEVEQELEDLRTRYEEIVERCKNCENCALQGPS